MEQKSTKFFDTLENIKIRTGQDIALFNLAKESILALGELEHTGDWDPYLSIELITGTKIQSTTGYSEIIFGDFNNDEQDTYLRHNEEITSIGIHMDNPENEEEPIIRFFQLNQIKTISLNR